jgi:DNA repair protein RadC
MLPCRLRDPPVLSLRSCPRQRAAPAYSALALTSLSRFPQSTRETIMSSNDDTIIEQALRVLETRLKYAHGVQLTSPDDTKRYLRLKMQTLEHEVFSVLFLDNRHRLISYEEMFRGTIDGASVHPREVVKRALAHNAAAVILAHNHPSGVAEPSRADESITRRLKEALALVEVRVLDHLIVGSEITSMAERGLV